MNGNQNRLRAIAYPLPEDIEKLKWAGRMEECCALIRRRLEEDIPQALRWKLEMEQAQIARLLRDYTVPEADALRILSEKLRDFLPEELPLLRRDGDVDWIFRDGQYWYIDTFYDNLLKTRPDIRTRQLRPEATDGARSEAQIRDEIISRMKRHDGAACRIRLRAVLTADPPDGEEVRIWLPYPVEGYQMRNLHLERLTPDSGEIAPPDASQRTVFWSGKDLRQAELVYSVENHIRYICPDPEQVSMKQPEGYLDELLPHIQFTPYLRALTQEVVGGETNPLKRARLIYNYITQNIRYSYMRGYLALPVIPEYCAARRRGDCGVQALLFITMCRIAGIPARWQSGLYVNENGAGSHDWAMFYVAPFGWMFTDCSFGGAAWRDGAKDRWDFYFCNLDPYRIVLATEFQQDFQPASRYLRADPYDNQQGEAELASGPLARERWDHKTELISAELL